ncbi:hypothetical protein CI238_05556 [Colletotrichum incanum]|uniref:Clr5 domain-containing protein n=1 Tax=Colletotrichum incanum TaxID=1573173 RepID=A0A161WMT3_COLIC|nr:hypothetical protein CI238_05556 [Colletotrichum incanum]
MPGKHLAQARAEKTLRQKAIMPKQRAIRKSPGQWAALRTHICDLYTNKKLEDVISHLAEQQKFVVTKRQLVYRLNKWGCKKYNKEDDEGDERDSEGSSGSCKDYIDDDTDNEDDPMTDIQVTHDIQRANALYAVSDGKSAWKSYYVAAGFDGIKSLVALARSAETLEQCQRVLEILEQRVSQSSDAVTSFWCHLLYFHVCETMSYETGQNGVAQLKEHIKESIVETISSLLAGEGNPDGMPNFLLKESGSLDMIALILLDSIYEEGFLLSHNAADDQLLLNLLWQTNDWVLSGGRGQASPSPPILVLTQCAQWCQEQLLHVSEKHASNGLDGTIRPNLRVPAREHQQPWRNHVEVFGTLWNRLTVQGRCDGVTGTEWTRACTRSLGISHEELLSCMCWVILRCDAASRAVSGGEFNSWDGVWVGGGEGGFDARELFERAEIAARVVAEWVPEDLWKAFLFAFRSVSSVTITGGGKGDVGLREEVREFKDAVMTEFRAFVNMTLGDIDGGVGEDEVAAGPQMRLKMDSVSPGDLGDRYIF